MYFEVSTVFFIIIGLSSKPISLLGIYQKIEVHDLIINKDSFDMVILHWVISPLQKKNIETIIIKQYLIFLIYQN